MPYAPEAKQKSRERILDAALALFKARGFEHVSIDEIMGEAGLTRGAFYAHFNSKSDLIAQAFLEEGQHPSPAANGITDMKAFLDAYLSALHRDNPAGGCAAATLTQDVTREGEEARGAYTVFVKHFLDVIDGYLGNRPGQHSDDALALMAQMVGTMQLARAVSDPMLSTRLIKAGRQGADYLLPPEDD